MHKRIKTKWLKALRSGKYRQGQNALRDGCDRFCCLGVLCDVYAEETGRAWMENPCGYSIHGESSGLPNQVVSWAGLADGNPELPSERFKHDSLIAQNDDAKASFKRIANIIEKYL